MKRAILFEKRKKAQELRMKGWSILKISRYLVANWRSVKKWVELGSDGMVTDGRGRRKGARVKYDKCEIERIIQIRQDLENCADTGIGSKFIRDEYKKRYGRYVSEWFINKTIREYKESKGSEKNEVGGEVCADFPIRKLRRFGKVIMCIDVMCVSSSGNMDDSLFLVCKYIYPRKRGIVAMVKALRSNEIIQVLRYIWHHYEKPDLVKMSYHPAFGGRLPHLGCIGKVPKFLLSLGIIPFYSDRKMADCQSKSKEAISIFSTPFMQPLRFSDTGNVNLIIKNFFCLYTDVSASDDELLEGRPSHRKDVYAASKVEARWLDRVKKSDIFFLNTVKPSIKTGSAGGYGTVEVLSTPIRLSVDLVGSVVLCKLDLKKKSYVSIRKTIEVSLS